MKSKLIRSLAIATLLTQLIVTNVFSATIDTKDKKQKFAQNLPTVTNNINFNGQNVDLYIEFENQKDALKLFEKNYKTELSFIQKNLGLEKLTSSNWQEYYNALMQLNDLIKEIPENILNNIVNMELFFDVYENAYKNIEIATFYNEMQENGLGKSRIVDSTKLEELNMLLPYTSEIDAYGNNIFETKALFENLSDDELTEGMKKSPKIQTFATPGINLTAAINYASTYATNRNTGNYATYSSDCTNFVSQILENSGISQVPSSSEYSGWWHKKVDLTAMISQHKHSVSWINADTFCRYMGVNYRTTSHSSFSTRIFEGDIIAYDKYSDGDYDHVAFVTQADNYTANYGGKIYYDYKVAQHSTDYHLWTSNSGNGWENLEDSGYTYAIIRK